jgi:type II secretory pathway component GspD/PulD (secretin)
MVTCENDLIKTIQNTIAPKSWTSHGGRGTIDYFPMTMTLVINQTPDIQEQIADLLAALRRNQDTQVALEVRVVSVPDQFFERVGVDFNINIANEKAPQPCPPPAASTQRRTAGFINDFTPDKFLSGLTPAKSLQDLTKPICGSKSEPIFLSDVQVFQFLEAVQGDQRTNIIMQAPKVTMFNGQTAHVDCTDKQRFVTGVEVVQRDGKPVVSPKTEEVVTGFRMTTCPKVSADRRSVQLDLDINQTDAPSSAAPCFPVTIQLKDSDGKPVQFTQFLQQPKTNTMRIEKKLTIPDGGTALLGGLKREVVGRCEFGPPILSRVPYVNRLFRKVGVARETETVYVLVTPRVIVNEEEEQRQTGVTRTDPPCCTRAPKACAEKCEAAEAPSHGQAKVIAELLKAYDEECEAAEAPSHGQAKVIAELLKAYGEACAAGHKEEAGKLAQAALILDPTCFAKARGK